MRDPVRPNDSAEPRDVTAPPESNRRYLQRLAEMLFKSAKTARPRLVGGLVAYRARCQRHNPWRLTDLRTQRHPFMRRAVSP